VAVLVSVVKSVPCRNRLTHSPTGRAMMSVGHIYDGHKTPGHDAHAGQPATMAVRMVESIRVPTCICLWAGESIPMQR